jgi:hypothetical protein
MTNKGFLQSSRNTISTGYEEFKQVRERFAAIQKALKKSRRGGIT